MTRKSVARPRLLRLTSATEFSLPFQRRRADWKNQVFRDKATVFSIDARLSLREGSNSVPPAVPEARNAHIWE